MDVYVGNISNLITEYSAKLVNKIIQTVWECTY